MPGTKPLFKALFQHLNGLSEIDLAKWRGAFERAVAGRRDGMAWQRTQFFSSSALPSISAVAAEAAAPSASGTRQPRYVRNERSITIYAARLPPLWRAVIIGQDTMSDSDLAVSIALGIGLAAATGFRVFLPMLITSAAAYSGHLPLGENFAWLGTAPALAMLGVAAVVEILAYYIPGVDNLLDTLATPAAFVAGSIVSAAVMADVSPMLKWTTAIIAGGGIAGVTQGVTALLRAKSTVFTAGVGNPVIATAELGGSLLVSLLALAAPIIAVVVVAVFLWLAIRLIRKIARRARPAKTEAGG